MNNIKISDKEKCFQLIQEARINIDNVYRIAGKSDRDVISREELIVFTDFISSLWNRINKMPISIVDDDGEQYFEKI